MDFLRSAIDGPYALLLILQILVVSGLLLTLVWLFIYRVKELGQGVDIWRSPDASSHLPASPEVPTSHIPVVETPVASAPVVDAGTPIILGQSDGLMDLTNATMGELSAAAMGLHAQESMGKAKLALVGQSSNPGDGIMEMRQNPGASDSKGNKSEQSAIGVTSDPQKAVDAEMLQHANAETEELKHKIEYLEQKLLEYEIVQEEIANLSSLKMENEKLRENLVQAQRVTKPSTGGSSGGDTGGTTGSSAAKVENVGPLEDTTQKRNFGTDTSILVLDPERPKEEVYEVPPKRAPLSESAEPPMEMGGTNPVAGDVPPEPKQSNVFQFPVDSKEPSLGDVKEAAQAFEDPKMNNQIEKILSKLEQLTTK